MLDVRNLHAFYGASHVLHGVEFSVQQGEVVALLGRNGMGKTTTVRAVAGHMRQSTGSVRLAGDEILGLRADRISHKGVAVVPQGRRIFPSLTVRENLQIGRRRKAVDRRWSLDAVYSMFPILEKRSDVSGIALSGGEQQMLAIARALMTNPNVLLMDEPSEGLSPAMVSEVGETIRSLASESLTILLVEQNLPLALSVSDRTYVMSKGAVVHEATSQELRDDEELKHRLLGVFA
jgi:branched-chain amino acid transport system ATP-binding protein